MSQKEAKGNQKAAKGSQKGTKGEPRGNQNETKDDQNVSKKSTFEKCRQKYRFLDTFWTILEAMFHKK